MSNNNSTTLVVGLMLLCCVCSSSSGAAYFFMGGLNNNSEDDDQSGGGDPLKDLANMVCKETGFCSDKKGNVSYGDPFGLTSWGAGPDGAYANAVFGSGVSYNEDGGLTLDAPGGLGGVTVGGDSGTGFDTPIGGVNYGSDGHVRIDTLFGRIKI